jgi:hypothetical protein
MMRRANKQTRKVTRKVTQEMRISHPPQIGQLNIAHSTRMRFTATSLFQGNITFQNCWTFSLSAQPPRL